MAGMTPVVVDTDVASFIFKRHAFAAQFEPLLSGRIKVLSVMSVAEMRLWSQIYHWGPAKLTEFESFLSKHVIVPHTEEIASVWADATYRARRAGRPLPAADAWVAATALAYGIPLLTHNASDFAGVSGLTILAP